MDPMQIVKSLSPDDFSQICRICLNSEHLRYIPETLIENIEATVLLENIVAILFDESDLMPANICDKCLMTLLAAYKLKKQCVINERLFHLQINKYKSMKVDNTIGQEIVQNVLIKTEEETIVEHIRDRVTSLGKHEMNIKTEPNEVDYKPKNSEANGPIIKEMEQDMINSMYQVNKHRNDLNFGSMLPSPVIVPVPPQTDQVSTMDISVCQQRTSALNQFRKVQESENKIQITEDSGGDIKTSIATNKSIASINQTIGLIEPSAKKRKRRCYFKTPCTVCKKLIGHRWMKFHLITHDEDRPEFQCDECSRSFKDEYRLKLHKLKHIRERGFNCPNPKCKKEFRIHASLKYHMKVCRADKPNDPEEFFCKVCGQIFLRRHTLRKHLTEHIARNEAKEDDIAELIKDCPFTCDLCSQFFETEHHLKGHMSQTHNEASFLCSICGKNLSSNDALARHMQIHNGNKPHSCEVCHKTFTSRYEVRSHMFSHTDERPFQCHICEKKFKSSAALNKHVFLHNGKKPYKCKYCEKSFAEPGNLRKHTATHTGEKRYFCSICNKGFYERNMVRSHEARHKSKTKKDSEPSSDNGE